MLMFYAFCSLCSTSLFKLFKLNFRTVVAGCCHQSTASKARPKESVATAPEVPKRVVVAGLGLLLM